MQKLRIQYTTRIDFTIKGKTEDGALTCYAACCVIESLRSPKMLNVEVFGSNCNGNGYVTITGPRKDSVVKHAEKIVRYIRRFKRHEITF